MSKKRRNHEEEGMDESWLIPYADLLTLLLALFIVLYAASTIDAQKYNAMRQAFSRAFDGGAGILDNNTANGLDITSGSVDPLLELQQIQQQIDQYFQGRNMTSVLESRINGDVLVISIRDHALFDSGSAVIKSEARETIIAIANMLAAHPGLEVLVSGHTDNVPINNWQFESNWDLSTERALNILKLILSNGELDPSNFSAIGYAEYRPVASNESAEGRAKNRRVEFAIKRKANMGIP